jgi:hypothetical protein
VLWGGPWLLGMLGVGPDPTAQYTGQELRLSLRVMRTLKGVRLGRRYSAFSGGMDWKGQAGG